MGDRSFNTQQLILLLAVVALVIGLVFHIIYLVKDRSVETAQDEYNKNNALMFFGAAIALAVVGSLWGMVPRVHVGASVDL
jgi:heme/copper-type cytochrome/quinol oxidase subunit 4